MATKNLRNYINETKKIHFYLRPEFIPVFEQFTKIISKDENVSNLRTNFNRSYRSAGICYAISLYVNDNLHLIDPNVDDPLEDEGEEEIKEDPEKKVGEDTNKSDELEKELSIQELIKREFEKIS